jgi:hypothetical protein
MGCDQADVAEQPRVSENSEFLAYRAFSFASEAPANDMTNDWRVFLFPAIAFAAPRMCAG